MPSLPSWRYRATMQKLFTVQPVLEPRAELQRWYRSSPLGQRLRTQLTRDMQVILDQWFGYNLVVIGPDADIPIEDLTRVQHVIQLLPTREPVQGKRKQVLSDDELPFASESIDVVVAMHALDLSDKPHQLLREIHRVLTPHGHLLLVGNNNRSLRGVWRQVLRLLPGGSGWRNTGPGRMEDWLTLLDFAVAPIRHKLVLPLSGRNRVGRWCAAVDNWLVDHNIPLGSTYMIFADKLVRGHIQTPSIERAGARLVGLRVPKPVVGARGSASRSPLRPVD